MNRMLVRLWAHPTRALRRMCGRPLESVRRPFDFWLAYLVVACVLPVWIAAGFLVYYNYQSRRALTEQRMLGNSAGAHDGR
jgi:hypothetical protein